MSRYWAIPMTFVTTFLSVFVIDLLVGTVPTCIGHPLCSGEESYEEPEWVE